MFGINGMTCMGVRCGPPQGGAATVMRGAGVRRDRESWGRDGNAGGGGARRDGDPTQGA